MDERDKLFPNPYNHHPMIHPDDYDAGYGELDPDQEATVRYRASRASWVGYTAAATILVTVVGGGTYIVTHQDRPRTEAITPTPSAPEVAVTSASPSESNSPSASASPTPSASPTLSKKPKKPSPSASLSPSHIPSPTTTESHIVIPVTPSAPATSETPQRCAWETSGGNVTVGECGDHTAYNDEQRTGAHQLPVGMMFGNVCMKGSMVAIHYGGNGNYDLVDDHGYFPIPGPC